MAESSKTILDEVTLTKAGRPVEGEPRPGVYYRARPKAPTADRAALGKGLRKAFPGAFFTVG